MPKRVIAFIAGIAAFLGIVVTIALWAAFSGDAGTQRGLVLRNATLSIVDVVMENGQAARIEPNDDATFVVRREEFPSEVRVETTDGDIVLESEVAWDLLVRAEFRVSFDENGFYPTSIVRSTPVRTPQRR